MATASIYARDISQIAGAAAGATAAGIAAVSGTSIAVAGATAAPLTLGISAAVAGLVAVIATFLKGANPLQVPAAKVEQCFELAAANIWTFYKLGMVSRASAVAGQQEMLAAAQQSLQALITEYPGAQQDISKAVKKALINVASSIGAEISDVQTWPTSSTEPVSRPLDFARAQSEFTSTVGWYPEAAEASLQLTEQWVANLTPPDSAEALISTIPGMQSAAAAISEYTGVSPAWAELLIGIVALYIIWRFFLR